MNKYVRYVQNIALFLLIGWGVQAFSVWLQSDFVETFLEQNLITLLLALLAINTTTISVIMSKLREISSGTGLSFAASIKSMKHSVIEQVILLIAAVIVLILKTSATIATNVANATYVANVLLVAIMLYAVQVLYDTANGVFVIAEREDEIERGDE